MDIFTVARQFDFKIDIANLTRRFNVAFAVKEKVSKTNIREVVCLSSRLNFLKVQELIDQPEQSSTIFDRGLDIGVITLLSQLFFERPQYQGEWGTKLMRDTLEKRCLLLVDLEELPIGFF